MCTDLSLSSPPITGISTRNWISISVKSNMMEHLGLPKIVVDLIQNENVNMNDNLRWKVVCNNNITQLTLTWDKNSPYIPVYHDQVSNRYGHGNERHRYNMYRRKSPSEIRRNQRRKIQFLQRRLQEGENTMTNPTSEPLAMC